MYLRIRPLGSVPSVGEKWTISPAYRWVPFTSQFDQAMLQSLAGRLITNISNTTLGQLRDTLSSSVVIAGWRVEQYNESEQLQASAEATYATALAGINNPTKSLQDAVVCSLKTYTPGARGRGRVYWPGAQLTAANFRITAPTITQLANSFKALFLAIQAEINAEALANGFGNVSELAVRSVSTHESLMVVSLAVGDIIDTQRRRRDMVAETRVAVSYCRRGRAAAG
jgi:hypothetical protein